MQQVAVEHHDGAGRHLDGDRGIVVVGEVVRLDGAIDMRLQSATLRQGICAPLAIQTKARPDVSGSARSSLAPLAPKLLLRHLEITAALAHRFFAAPEVETETRQATPYSGAGRQVDDVELGQVGRAVPARTIGFSACS